MIPIFPGNIRKNNLYNSASVPREELGMQPHPLAKIFWAKSVQFGQN